MAPGGIHRCCVCGNTRIKDPNISLHRFPKEKQRCEEWVKALNIPLLKIKSWDQLSALYAICTNHFEKHHFFPQSRRLASTAVPLPPDDASVFHFESFEDESDPDEPQMQQDGDVSVDLDEKNNSKPQLQLPAFDPIITNFGSVISEEKFETFSESNVCSPSNELLSRLEVQFSEIPNQQGMQIEDSQVSPSSSSSSEKAEPPESEGSLQVMWEMDDANPNDMSSAIALLQKYRSEIFNLKKEITALKTDCGDTPDSSVGNTTRKSRGRPKKVFKNLGTEVSKTKNKSVLPCGRHEEGKSDIPVVETVKTYSGREEQKFKDTSKDKSKAKYILPISASEEVESGRENEVDVLPSFESNSDIDDLSTSGRKSDAKVNSIPISATGRPKRTRKKSLNESFEYNLPKKRQRTTPKMSSNIFQQQKKETMVYLEKVISKGAPGSSSKSFTIRNTSSDKESYDNSLLDELLQARKKREDNVKKTKPLSCRKMMTEPVLVRKVNGDNPVMVKRVISDPLMVRKMINKPVIVKRIDSDPLQFKKYVSKSLEIGKEKNFHLRKGVNDPLWDENLLVRKEKKDTLMARKNKTPVLLMRNENEDTSSRSEENDDASSMRIEDNNETEKTNNNINGLELKDKYISLPNDFIRLEFAKPRRQVVFKLMPKSETTKLRCSSLLGLLDSLREKNFLHSEIEELLNLFGILPKGLRQISDDKVEMITEYPEDVMKFASLLFINSQKTYDIVKTYFMLPAKVFVKETFQVKDYWPGFTKEALKKMNEQVSDFAGDRLCSIMFDSVTVKKRLELDKSSGKWIGHVDLGCGQSPYDADEFPLATEVLMFTAVGLRTNWKMPFGYFMHKSISGEFLENLVLLAIRLLEENDLKVRAVVCNGSGITVKMAKLLGCTFEGERFVQIVPSFPHPTRKNQCIYVVFGVKNSIHRLEKLLREIGILQNHIYGRVDWKYLRQFLGDKRLSKNLECSTLQSPKHLEFYHLQRISRFCSSVFTRTVSSALKMAKELEIDGYVSSKDTSNFVADVHRALCLLNSRNPVSSEEKPCIRQITLPEQVESMNSVAERLFGLETNFFGRICQEKQWMSTVLLSFTLKSVNHLAAELVNEAKFQHFNTYRLNMDHFDMVLSSLQRHGDWDDVPTPQEFRNAYKNLFNQLNKKILANYDFDGEDLTVAQGEIYMYRNYGVKYDCYFQYPVFTDLETDVFHLAETIIHQVSRRLSCADCVSILVDDNHETYCKGERVFVNLIRPSRFILRILKSSRKILNMKLIECTKFRTEQLVLFVNREYFSLFENLYLSDFAFEHFVEEPYHIICLMKVIVRCYINSRLCKREKFKREYKIPDYF